MKHNAKQYLVQLRLSKGLTQVAMGRIAGSSGTTIFHLEAGHFPRPSNIPRIAQAYGITPQELVTKLYEKS